MRILSQDGMIDFPYEQTVINIDYRNKINIIANGVNCNDCESYMVAKYSTEAKSQKAMKMLREAYMVHVIFKNMSEQQRSVFVTSVLEKEQENLYGVFRFPSDDEIEV